MCIEGFVDVVSTVIRGEKTFATVQYIDSAMSGTATEFAEH